MAHRPTPSPASGLRVGLIGTGAISAPHIAGWRELGADLVLYSRSGASEAASRIGAQAASSITELIDASDVVGILSPPRTHRDYALAALAAGKHVVCEKPLARTLEGSLDMAAAAVGSGAILFPAHVVRYFPAYAQAHARVTRGEIGPVMSTRFLRAGAAPPAGSWFFDEEASGGILMDQLVHDLDQARWFAGEVVSVYGARTTRVLTGAPVHTAAVLLTHASGAISQVNGQWGPPALTFTTGFDLVGERATLRHATMDTRSLVLDPSSSGPVDYIPGGGAGESPFTAQLREVLAAIRDGVEPRVSVLDAVVAVAIAEAALASARSGTAVTIDEGELSLAVHTRVQAARDA